MPDRAGTWRYLRWMAGLVFLVGCDGQNQGWCDRGGRDSG